MLDKLLSVATTNAKLALAAAAGAAHGAGGAAVAITPVSSDTATTTTVTGPVKGGEHASDTGREHRSDTATATISPKPSKSPKADSEGDGAQGVHGACVSAVAQDKSTEGRDHGKAVSEAAHNCPKGDDAAGDAADTDADDDSAKPAKPAKGEHGRSAEHKPSSD
jgi:hypothetical protein